MGNTDSARGRSTAHASSASDSPRNQSKPQKVKSPNGDRSQAVSAASTVFYSYDSTGYYTCKPDVVAGTKDIPAYYFTASQLRNAKKKSKSHDAGLNRIFSVADGQRTDVQHMALSTSYRKSDNDAVSMIFYVIYYC